MFFALCIPAATTHAQTSMPVLMETPACTNLSANLGRGTQDTATHGDVASLQSFLSALGFFPSTNLGTGHFGPLTMASVVRFQLAHNIPGTGFVGPLTRAEITRVSCPTVPPVTTTPPRVYTTFPSPTSFMATTSITGFGFTASNTILLDGMVALRNVPITSAIAISCTTSPSCHGGINQTLSVVLPDTLSPNCPKGSMCAMYVRLIGPGTYKLSIQNENGVSDELPITIATTTPSMGMQ